MIVVSRRLQLPVGQRYTPPSSMIVTRRASRNIHVRKIILSVPGVGEYAGPFFVHREATFAEYCEWFAGEYGEPIAAIDKPALRQHRFYDISLD
jgi:hypothetical protein